MYRHLHKYQGKYCGAFFLFNMHVSNHLFQLPKINSAKEYSERKYVCHTIRGSTGQVFAPKELFTTSVCSERVVHDKPSLRKSCSRQAFAPKELFALSFQAQVSSLKSLSLI